MGSQIDEAVRPPGLFLHSIQPTALLNRRLKAYSLERLIKISGMSRAGAPVENRQVE